MGGLFWPGLDIVLITANTVSFAVNMHIYGNFPDSSYADKMHKNAMYKL